MYKHILVPVDGSEMSDAVVRAACEFARDAGARLTFYHAKPPYFPPVIAGEALFEDGTAYAAFRSGMDKQSQAILRGAMRTADAAGVACDILSEERDTPYQGIIAAAADKGCDLIFMASHGRRGMSALLLGSETQKVLTHCQVPVLVFR